MFSSLHGGKSSLRGQCVQPCRRHYLCQSPKKSARAEGRKKEAKYLFSMNDLCGVDVLPELRAAGVSSLKIEGRLKSARYVANTVAAYRMALDCLDESDEEQERVLQEAHRLLDEAMARRRSPGYLLSEKPLEAISPEQSGNSGQLLGRVQRLLSDRGRDGATHLHLHLRLEAQVRDGDRLRLHNERSGERISFTLRRLNVGGQRCPVGKAGQKVELVVRAEIKGEHGRNFRGSLFKVDVGSRLIAERSGRKRSKKLSTRTVTADKRVVEKILENLCCRGGDQRKKRTSKKKKGKWKTGENTRAPGRRSGSQDLPWWVVVADVVDLRHRLPVRPARVLVPLSRETMRSLGQQEAKIKKYRGRLIWRLPPIISEADLPWYRSCLERLVSSGYRRFELGHCCQYGLFDFLGENMAGLELYGQYSLNLLNSASLQAASRLGLDGVVFSLEGEAENLGASVAHFKRQKGRGRRSPRMKIGLYAYGRPPLFTSRLESKHYDYRQQLVSPKDELYTLEHENGLTLARAILPFSLLHWQEELRASGVDYLVLDLSGGAIRQEAATVGRLLGAGRQRLPVLTGNFHGILL